MSLWGRKMFMGRPNLLIRRKNPKAFVYLYAVNITVATIKVNIDENYCPAPILN